MRLNLTAAVLLSAFMLPHVAQAEQRPVPLPADGRIKQFVYNEMYEFR